MTTTTTSTSTTTTDYVIELYFPGYLLTYLLAPMSIFSLC